MSWTRAIGVLLCCVVCGPAAWGMTPEERQEYRTKLLEILPEVQSFRAWIERTNALPPDFDALPQHNGLPDPLKMLDGTPITTPAQWEARRAEIRKYFELYQLGSIPPKPPITEVVVQEETQHEGYLDRTVQLKYGPEGRGTIQVRVVIPAGDGPFGVLVAPSLAGWASSLIPRGYISCGYAGENLEGQSVLASLYPDHDFGGIARQAFAAQFAVDYLYTLPQVDKSKIAITGYSRAGKMAVTAAALDSRITAVIAGSTGVGGVTPWRLAGERTMGESIESTTRMFPTWYAPQFRFFAGREDRLPVDANLMVALLAPRPVLMQYGLNDEVANSWSNEQTFHNVKPVYKFLGNEEGISILRNPGFHSTGINQQVALDWLDIQWGRSNRKWHNDLLFPWDYEEWKTRSGATANFNELPSKGIDDILKAQDGSTIASKEQWEQKEKNVLANVEWVLGKSPVKVQAAAGGRGGRGGGLRRGGGRDGGRAGGRDGGRAGGADGARDGGRAGGPDGGRGRAGAGGGRGRGPAGPNPAQLKPDVPKWVIGRNIAEFGWRDPDRSAVNAREIRFGDGVVGDLYTPIDAPEGQKLPVIIWLHGYSYPIGYMWVYRMDTHPVLALAQSGYAVLAFDQSGFGMRMEESGPFYERQPQWSRLARMVQDVRDAVTALQADEGVDGSKIWLFGYSLGGNVALHAAAADDRITGVVASCAFSPYRTDLATGPTGGLSKFSHEIGLAPRLGLFIGNESKVPYDYHELIAAIAPRPVYIHSPLMNREAIPGDVKTAVEQARLVYGLYDAPENLHLSQPWDYHRLPTSEQDAMIAWLKQQAK